MGAYRNTPLPGTAVAWGLEAPRRGPEPTVAGAPSDAASRPRYAFRASRSDHSPRHAGKRPSRIEARISRIVQV